MGKEEKENKERGRKIISLAKPLGRMVLTFL
jgi:hypothetical protein